MHLLFILAAREKPVAASMLFSLRQLVLQSHKAAVSLAWWRPMLLIPTLGKEKWVDLCDSEASLVYIAAKKAATDFP